MDRWNAIDVLTTTTVIKIKFSKVEICFKNVNDVLQDKFKSMSLKRNRKLKIGTSTYHKACCIAGSV